MTSIETPDPGLEAQVDRSLGLRVGAGEPVALLAHLLLIGTVTFLVWGVVRTPLLVAWAGAVSVAVAVRGVISLRLGAVQMDPTTRVRAIRLSVTALGIAWGLGAAAVAPEVLARHIATILVVIAGLVAGAASSLDADPMAFRLFLFTILGPLPFGILLNGRERVQEVLAVLTVFFGGYMWVLNKRAYGLLRDQVRASILLTASEAHARQERAYLETLVASAPSAIAVLAGDDSVRLVNPAFHSLFGYRLEEVMGRDVGDLLVPEGERERTRELHARARAGETAVTETMRRRKDGSLVPVRVAAAAVGRDPNADIFFIYEDITEPRRAEQALREARDAAEQLARTRSAFLANMSHEIRTPMNAVVGFVELLLDTDLTAEQRRALELVRSSAEALLTILNDVLDFSKIEAEHLELETIPFDLQKLIHSTVGLLAVRAREKHLELISDVPADLPTLVRGDPTRLRQVLTNLIGNAIKFTDEGEIVVTATLAGAVDGAVRVRFSVRDTGIGIAPDHLATIFREFAQADVSMTRRYGGTGLGLTISKRLVGLMGGEISVTSAPGRGSDFVFTIVLPVEASAPAEAATVAVPLGGRRILIVDDNETNRRILRDILAGEGMAVREATSASAGIAALAEASQAGAPVELAIIDVQMPDRDGFSLATDIKANPQIAETRLLVLTSAGQRGDAQRCREIGIQGYLTKPASRADLLEAVIAILSGPAVTLADAGVITRHTIAEARRRLRILLAEDNPVNQQVATAMLGKRGHEVDVVGDGAAAVEAVRRGAYDVVLMDIQMPEMDGFAATAAIRALPDRKDLPIIALTAHALSGERERCLARGMTGYLTKPFRSHELFGLVEGWADPGPLAPPAPATPAVPAAPAAPAAATAAASPVDLEQFRQTMREAGAEEAVDAILDTFLAAAPQRLADLGAAAARGDAAAIAAAAHAFKSAAASIGARALAGHLAGAEQAGRAGDLATASAHVASARGEADTVIAYLQRARGTGTA
ncbi:MAG TPA: response regulator [Gemmatimonadales bacterium]|nr:response regulator [Gemmatimonadales bacterium]